MICSGAIVVVEHSVQSGNMFSHRAELSLQASRAKLPVTVGATEPLTPAQVKYMIVSFTISMCDTENNSWA